MWRPLKMDNSAGFSYLRPGVWLFYFSPVNLARVLVLFSSLNSLWHLVFHCFLFHQVQPNPAFSFQNSKVSLASHSLVFRKQLVQCECHSSLDLQPHFPAEDFSWHCLNIISMGLVIHCFCPYFFCGSRKTETNRTCTSYLLDLLRDWEQATYS